MEHLPPFLLSKSVSICFCCMRAFHVICAQATYGSSLTDAQVDAITLAAVNAAIDTQIVQFATASTLCESTSGELGFCDVSAGFTGTWYMREETFISFSFSCIF